MDDGNGGEDGIGGPRHIAGLKALAAELGLSKSTVSRVLNGHPSVRPETRERVLAYAEAAGFRLNAAGRRLKTRTNDIVAFVLSAPQADFAIELFLKLIGGLDDALRPAGKMLLVTAARDRKDEIAILRDLVDGGNVDAVAFGRIMRDDERIAFLEARGFPFATIGALSPRPRHPAIDFDHGVFGGAAADRLLGLGHRHLLLLSGPPPLLLSADAENGMRERVAAAGGRTDVAPTDLTEEGGYKAARAALEMTPRPTGIVCINDLVAFGAYRALTERGLVPGREVSVIGAHNISGSAYAAPPLTTFEMHARDAGRRLGELLLAHLKAPAEDYAFERFAPEIVQRASDGPVRSPARVPTSRGGTATAARTGGVRPRP